MSEFKGSLEGKIQSPEQIQAPEMSHEAECTLGDLFKDDFEGIKIPEKEPPTAFDNVKDEVGKLFADDYSESTENSENSEDASETEKVDLMKQYKPNSIFEVDGQSYETDDNGSIYKVDGYELLPNSEYTIGDVTYKTDELGRITSCDGYVTLTPEGERDNKAQAMAGGEDIDLKEDALTIEMPSWFDEKLDDSESKSKIPTPKESEEHAQEIYGGEEQKSFLGGKAVPWFTPGSTRPDLVVDNHLAIEVKNYNLNSETSCNNLCQELRRQIGDRVENLPEGYEQKVVLDIRGRDYAEGTVDDVIKRIKDKCSDIYPDISVDVMEV